VRTEGEGGAVEEVEQRHLVASAAVVFSSVRAAARTRETIGRLRRRVAVGLESADRIDRTST
jgi:hypothetical protein